MARAAFTCCHPPSPLLPGSEQTGSPVASTLRLLAAPRPRDGDSAESPGLSRLRVQLSDPWRLHRPVGGARAAGGTEPAWGLRPPAVHGASPACRVWPRHVPWPGLHSFSKTASLYSSLVRQDKPRPPRPHTQVFAPGSPAPLRVPPPEPTHVATNPPPTFSILSFRDNQRAPNARGVGTPTLPG